MIHMCHELDIQPPLFEDLGTSFASLSFPCAELPAKERRMGTTGSHKLIPKKHRKISAKEAQQISE